MCLYASKEGKKVDSTAFVRFFDRGTYSAKSTLKASTFYLVIPTFMLYRLFKKALCTNDFGQKSRYNIFPLTEKTTAALRDYILDGRRQTDCESLFLKLRLPYEKIGDAFALDCMFRSYQKTARIEHSAFDGKVFHSLRHRLGKELVIDGVPLAIISQILGHRDMGNSETV